MNEDRYQRPEKEVAPAQRPECPIDVWKRLARRMPATAEPDRMDRLRKKILEQRRQSQ